MKSENLQMDSGRCRSLSGFKSALCSSRGPEFSSKHPHLAIHNHPETLAPRSLMPLLASMAISYMCLILTYTHINMHALTHKHTHTHTDTLTHKHSFSHIGPYTYKHIFF